MDELISDYLANGGTYTNLFINLQEHLNSKIQDNLELIATSSSTDSNLEETVIKDIKEYLYLNLQNMILLIPDEETYLTLQYTSCHRNIDDEIIIGETMLTHEDNDFNLIDEYRYDFKEKEIDIAINQLIKRFVYCYNKVD